MKINWRLKILLGIIAILWLIGMFFTITGCKTTNKANYGNKAGQGKYWKEGAKKNHHRL